MGRTTLLLLSLLAVVICLIPLAGCIPNLNPNSTSDATPKAEKASIGTIYDHVRQLENNLESMKTDNALREKNLMAEIELIKSRLQAIEAKLK
jgi:outer membrane murein-binding lipoprotein Lpp